VFQVHDDRLASIGDRQTLLKIDKDVYVQWQSLNAGQKSCYIQHADQLSHLSSSIKHRAFRCFYHVQHDTAKEQDQDVHANFNDSQRFTEKLLAERRALHTTQQDFIIDIVSQEMQYTVPSLRSFQLAPTLHRLLQKHPLQSVYQVDTRAATAAQTLKREESESLGGTDCIDSDSSHPRSQDAPVHLNLTDLFVDKTPELEESVQTGLVLPQNARQTLDLQPSQDAQQWLPIIENIENQAVKTKTIIGVLGGTEPGKSSVINAIIDEERLVPTNCTRACIAVATEISYNHEEIRYRAEIEFISREDWAKN
jgi:hypothetical protein